MGLFTSLVYWHVLKYSSQRPDLKWLLRTAPHGAVAGHGAPARPGMQRAREQT